jgi:hypothetical protein
VTTFAGFGGMTEPEFKQIYSYLFAPAGATATTGVLSGLAVAQTTTASGSVTIAVGAGVVQDALVSGATPVVNNASVTLDVFTSNPMSGVSTYADTLTVATLPAGITLPVTVHALALTVNATARSAAWVNTSGGVALYASAATTAFYTISGSYPTG